MVKWTAEKDQVLLKAVFQFLEIKTTPALLEHLAEQIGEGCTPKAISHRLNNIKNAGTPNKVPAADKAPLRKKLTPLKTPGSGRGRGRPPAKKVVHDDDDDAEDADDIPDNHFDGAMSPSAGRKRARQAAGAEDKFSKKKMKEEKFSDDEGVDVGESAEDGDHEDGEETEEEIEETEEEIDEI